jgi:dipeptidyl aminopeptidase/acylaminoacyl peptidase
MRLVGLFLASVVALPTFVAAEVPKQLESTPLAQAFGAAPVMWGVELSPDGTKLSAIQMHPQGVTMARVVSLVDGSSAVVLSGNDEFRIRWCDWANEERLLCGLQSVTQVRGGVYANVTRLVATKTDGTEMKVLITNQMDVLTQFHDRVIDWLPDDHEHVLVQMPSDEPGTFGNGVSRLNIYTGEVTAEERVRSGVTAWLSDGHGTPRLYLTVTQRDGRWLAKDTPDADWSLLHHREVEDLDDAFSPLGFGESRNELLFFDRNEGRMALFAYDLEHGRQRRLVYANPQFDVAGAMGLGKYQRLVAAVYIDDRPRFHFFDARVEAIQRALSANFPNSNVSIIDETWDQRYYLVYVSTATDAGTYYRFDSMARVLAKITTAYPALASHPLAPMTPVRYKADDGVEVPAYLTLPANRSGRVPAVILPHGGPSSRDYWDYNFLSQFLAASGYAVLQSNYRGSDGYGKDWEGEGGFRGWRRANGDIAAGTDYLVAEGIADPDKICAVGWSYGGYAALMSVIEQPQRYQCVVSIAGVTDPKTLGNLGGRGTRAFIGETDEVRKDGSPIERVAEIQVPLLVVQPREDANVPPAQATTFVAALRKAGKKFEFVEYEFAQHDIQPERYRTDLLARLGKFLDDNL